MNPTKSKTSTAFKTWSKRVVAYDGGAQISKPLIGALKRVITLSRRDLQEDKALHKLVDYRLNYENSLPALGPKAVRWQITPEQTTQGLELLRRPRLLKLLEPRAAAILDDFSHFLFVGFEVEDRTRHAGFPNIVAKPVYRVVSKKGHWFDYSSAPWQAGAFGTPSSPFTILAIGSR